MKAMRTLYFLITSSSATAFVVGCTTAQPSPQSPARFSGVPNPAEESPARTSSDRGDARESGLTKLDDLEGVERIVLGPGRERLIVTGYFHPDDAAVEPRFRDLLAKLARIVHRAEIDDVEVHGYADDEGTTHYNLAIADRRARAVARYLATLDTRLSGTVVTHGDASPAIEDVTGTEDHPRNRRVAARVDVTWPATAQSEPSHRRGEPAKTDARSGSGLKR